MKDFESIPDELESQLRALEPDRLRYHRASWFYLGVLVGPLAGGILGAVLVDDDSKIYFLIGSAVWFAIGLILYSIKAGSLADDYRRSYKEAVIPRLLALVDPGLRFDPASGISSGTFVSSELYSNPPDRYTTEDLIEGTHGKTSLRLAEVHAEDRQTTTDSKGRTQTRYVTIFKGLLLIADFNKHFQGRTFVFPDFAENLFGNFGRAFQKLGGRSDTGLIRLEDPEFEKAFAVYSTDEIEARYLLSTAMMQRLMNLRERFGTEVRIAFKESSIALAVPHRSGFLEPGLKTPASDESQIRGIYEELRLFLEIIDELDLNTRIWTKE
ncbi:MAG: DUF3137 domain-containing protein [Verrucomicrobiales bacterium]